MFQVDFGSGILPYAMEKAEKEVEEALRLNNQDDVDSNESAVLKDGSHEPTTRQTQGHLAVPSFDTRELEKETAVNSYAPSQRSSFRELGQKRKRC